MSPRLIKLDEVACFYASELHNWHKYFLERTSACVNIHLHHLCTLLDSVHSGGRNVQICHPSTMDMLEMYPKADANATSAQSHPKRTFGIP